MRPIVSVPCGALPVSESRTDRYVGAPATRMPISAPIGAERVYMIALSHEAGARVRPHTHTEQQILHFIRGAGIVAVDGGEDQRIEAGGYVCLPAGVSHMHGAADDEATCYVAIIAAGDASTFEAPVPDAWRRWCT
jgi:quercetin dioxygenase-like cupin family protein